MTCPFHLNCRTPCPIVAAAHAVQRDEDDAMIAALQRGHGHAGKSRAQGRINGVRYGKRLGGVLRRSA